MPSRAKSLLAVLPLLMFLSAPVHAQTAAKAKAPEQKAPARPPKYADSADGLKLLLQDVLASGKLGGSPKLAAFVYDRLRRRPMVLPVVVEV